MNAQQEPAWLLHPHPGELSPLLDMTVQFLLPEQQCLLGLLFPPSTPSMEGGPLYSDFHPIFLLQTLSPVISSGPDFSMAIFYGCVLD